MKYTTALITTVITSIVAFSTTSSFAATKKEKPSIFSFSKDAKAPKKNITAKNRKNILHYQPGSSDTNASLKKGRGVGFNGGFYGHSGGP